MKNRNQLMEDYEDIKFALLMESVAQQQGEVLLEENERLKNDPNFAVPEESTRRNLRLIRHTFLRQELAGVGRAAMKVLNKVAMFVLIATAFFTTAFAAFPQFRADTLNLLLEVFEDRTTISFKGNGDVSEKTSEEFPFTVGWVPEGYSLAQNQVGKTLAWVRYEDGSGNELTVCLDYNMTGSSIDIDTENAVVQNTEINGRSAMIVSKESELWDGTRVNLVIMDAVQKMVVSITAYGLSEQDVLHIAEKIVF